MNNKTKIFSFSEYLLLTLISIFILWLSYIDGNIKFNFIFAIGIALILFLICSLIVDIFSQYFKQNTPSVIFSIFLIILSLAYFACITYIQKKENSLLKEKIMLSATTNSIRTVSSKGSTNFCFYLNEYPNQTFLIDGDQLNSYDYIEDSISIGDTLQIQIAKIDYDIKIAKVKNSDFWYNHLFYDHIKIFSVEHKGIYF